MIIDPEAFAAWRADPITEWVMAGLKAAAEKQEATWHNVSWNAVAGNLEQRNTLRARYDAYCDMIEWDHAAFAALHEDDNGNRA